jgi:hypothetical protein
MKWLLIVWLGSSGPNGGVAISNIGHYTARQNCHEAGFAWMHPNRDGNQFSDSGRMPDLGYYCVPVE